MNHLFDEVYWAIMMGWLASCYAWRWTRMVEMSDIAYVLGAFAFLLISWDAEEWLTDNAWETK